MLADIKYWLRKKTFRYSTYETHSEDSVKLFWWRKKRNFGDIINETLVSSFCDGNIEWVPSNYRWEYYMAAGSIIHLAQDKTIIWGSGLISDRAKPLKTPKEVLAVRGPLTRDRLKAMKISCPEVYGDPALLIPEFYNPQIECKYELGIIPHFIDKNSTFFNRKFDENISIIDIEVDNPLDFINRILECKRILSSTLHGIIVSDAFDIPALRVKFSNSIAGGDFKFHDYYHSVKREIVKTPIISDKTKTNSLLDMNFKYSKNINLNLLKKSCPF